MENKKVTIADVIQEGNKLLANFEKYKIHNHNEFHNKVAEILKPYIIFLGFEFSIWDINILGEKILQYDRKFVEYKNRSCACKMQGNFSDVYLKNISEISDTVPIKELPAVVKAIQYNRRLNNAFEYVTKCELELLEAKSNLEKIKQEKIL